MNASRVMAEHNLTLGNASSAPIIARLLDPEPLDDEALERQVEWGWEDEMSFVNFHHPFYVGFVPPDIEEVAGSWPKDQYDTLRMATDPRLKIPVKHEHFHRYKPNDGIWLFERPYRPVAAYLMIRMGLFQGNDEDLAGWIRSLWSDTESASSGPWVLLMLAYPLIDTHDPDGILDGPSGVTKVYRGIGLPEGEEPRGEVTGMSWTTDRDQAIWFAKRFSSMSERSNPYLLHGTVKNENVLFTTNDRGESEVVSAGVEVALMERL